MLPAGLRERDGMKRAVFLILVVIGSGVSAIRAEPVRISGIYPHLAVYNGRFDPAKRTWAGTGRECGIGAIVPWAGKLWLITYPPHATRGGNDKLWSIDEKLNLKFAIESVGGTHAGRMIHRESNQLVIGPYFIDAKGKVRACDVKKKLIGRMTAVARHLTDPKNMVYLIDMEGAVYEVHVHTLAVKKLFRKPVPGDHAKGGYTAQRRLVIANNGERRPKKPGQYGVLAEWDGKAWRVIERKQFCDVTGPDGIYGGSDDKAPLWAIGWDRKSVILKLLDGGRWYTFRMPKASHAFDPKHGWYTEWPRIRRIAEGKLMMDMHGMFYDFPKGFSAASTGGITPIASHLRYIPDFCEWNGRLVLAADDTSIIQNPMAGKSQSNLWFGQVADVKNFGPSSGWGGVWMGDAVKADAPSTPFLIGGFGKRAVHLSVGDKIEESLDGDVSRCTDKYSFTELPTKLRGLARVTIARGDFHKPAPGYSFTVDRAVMIYLAVDARGKLDLGAEWKKTAMKAAWGRYADSIYVREFKAGRVEIPPHDAPHLKEAYGLPHACFLSPQAKITDLSKNLEAVVTQAETSKAAPAAKTGDVMFTLEIDAKGDGNWKACKQITVPGGGYKYHIFADDLKANWIRVRADKDCTATAYFHYASPAKAFGDDKAIFASLPKATDSSGGGLIRPAGHNTNLQLLTRDGAYLEVDEKMNFRTPAESRADEVKKIAAIKWDFTVDAASVIVTHKGKRYRLPKGDAAYDKLVCRGVRECVSERYLVNLHGTFYEMPRDSGAYHPGPELIKPVATHGRAIVDFCTWRGLMVISGTSPGAKPDGNYFASANGKTGLWFGHIDDLWKLGKPTGVGGPWKDSEVKAGAASDPYLMTGYDRKRLDISHDAGEAVEMTIEINFDHNGWHEYAKISVPSGKTATHKFPDGFNAHWVRLRSAKTCKATAIFTYE
jgi:hypothetical protein